MIALTEKRSGTYTFYDICIAYLWFQKYKENELVLQNRLFFSACEDPNVGMAFPQTENSVRPPKPH
jgi:hypothetical protein